MAHSIHTWKKALITRGISLLAASGLLGLSLPAHAMLVNPSFDAAEQTYLGHISAGSGRLHGWTVGTTVRGGRVFLAEPGQAVVDFSPDQSATRTLWDDGNGGANNVADASPAGGNFLLSNASWSMASIFQEVTGLVVGATYELTFWQAAGQLYGKSGYTIDTWRVSFGGERQVVNQLFLPGQTNFGQEMVDSGQWTEAYRNGYNSDVVAWLNQGGFSVDPINYTYTDSIEIISGGEVRYSDRMDVVNHGYVDWQKQTMRFTAAETTQYLGFLAMGTPSGQPPFSLLDGVELRKVPLPGSLLLLVAGLMLPLSRFLHKRRQRLQ